jgi:hypothetical protein
MGSCLAGVLGLAWSWIFGCDKRLNWQKCQDSSGY